MRAAWERWSSGQRRAAVTLVVVAIAGGGFLGGRAFPGAARVRVVRGEVERVGLDGVGVRLADREDPDAVFFVGSANTWVDVEGSTHDPGQPECLPPDSRGAVIEVGVIPETEGGYRNQVVWVRCITLPTGFVLGDDSKPPSLDTAYRRALERDS